MWKKLFSLTVHARSLSFSNLSDRWFVGFLNGFLFCQLFHRDPSHLPCNPLASLPPKILFCTNNDFEFPMSAFWQQLPDSWHHNSLCLCRKRLQKATERLSPCQCLWLFHRHWQVTSVFFFIYIFFLLQKSRQMFAEHEFWFQDTRRLPCSLLEVTLLLCINIAWVFPRSLPYVFSFITVTSF